MLGFFRQCLCGQIIVKELCNSPVKINANESPQRVEEALVALRDGESIVVDFVTYRDNGFAGTTGYAYALGDGTVLFTSFDYVDSYGISLPLDRYELKDAAFFEERLKEDEAARFQCLYAIIGDRIETCEG